MTTPTETALPPAGPLKWVPIAEAPSVEYGFLYAPPENTHVPFMIGHVLRAPNVEGHLAQSFVSHGQNLEKGWSLQNEPQVTHWAPFPK